MSDIYLPGWLRDNLAEIASPIFAVALPPMYPFIGAAASLL